MKLTRYLIFFAIFLSNITISKAQVSDPSLTVSGSTATTVTVTVNNATNGATINYTLDGSVPSSSSASVAAGSTITFPSGSTLKIQAFLLGSYSSDLLTVKYTSSGLVTSGGHHSIALKGDGSLWSWGNNNLGQLGNGNNVTNGLPSQLGLSGLYPRSNLASSTVVT